MEFKTQFDIGDIVSYKSSKYEVIEIRVKAKSHDDSENILKYVIVNGIHSVEVSADELELITEDV